MTVANEIVKKHLEYCNKVESGFKEVDGKFPFKVGDLIFSDSNPRIIGLVFGFVYCPITKQDRAVLGVNCDVNIKNSRKATDKEERAFNLFTNDLKPVEARYTAFF